MRHLFILLLLSACACEKAITPTKVDTPDNPDAQVEVLFKVENCTVYRFVDCGHYHYFSSCKGSSIEKSWYEQQGKVTVYKQEAIETK